MSQIDWWQDQADLLHRKNFLLPDETNDSLRVDLHYTKMWADSFWRRRYSHSKREDPEVKYVTSLNPKSILEIGSAYGRITQKVLDAINQSGTNFPEYTGIEVCPHFDQYFADYAILYPVLSSVNNVYDNFMKTEKLDKKFDLILLGMNTFPSFPRIGLEPTLEAVKRHLNVDGVFLFSTYKVPEEIGNQFLEKLQGDVFGGELQVDYEEKDILAMESVRSEILETEYGAHCGMYLAIHRLTREYRLLERAVFRSQIEFYRPKFLREILKSNDFNIKIWDDTSHSVTVGISPN